jgi:hypothetical protein
VTVAAADAAPPVRLERGAVRRRRLVTGGAALDDVRDRGLLDDVAREGPPLGEAEADEHHEQGRARGGEGALPALDVARWIKAHRHPPTATRAARAARDTLPRA